MIKIFNFKIHIFSFILGVLIATISGVSAAIIIGADEVSLSSEYTSKTTVKEALDELYQQSPTITSLYYLGESYSLDLTTKFPDMYMYFTNDNFIVCQTNLLGSGMNGSTGASNSYINAPSSNSSYSYDPTTGVLTVNKATSTITADARTGENNSWAGINNRRGYVSTTAPKIYLVRDPDKIGTTSKLATINYVGTAFSFNLQEKYPADYTRFTNRNFIVAQGNLTGSGMDGSSANGSSYINAPSATSSYSYDPTTGVLTITKATSNITANTTTGSGTSWASLSSRRGSISTMEPRVYLVQEPNEISNLD